MSKTLPIEPLRDEVLAHLPPGDGRDIAKNLELILKLLAGLQSGTGSFSTWTPAGRRWVVITDKDPAGS